MAHLAIIYDVVGHQQFGALPKRSATDLVSCVVHDVEEARSQGWASTFVTLDVQGAFDAVLHNRLVRRMQAQGWPDSILRWTTSFLTHRKVQVRFSGGVTTQKELVCGVPQGSPISPLLFLLYMAEPMQSGNPGSRFSYADDIGILGFGRTVAESAGAAQREVDHLLEWAGKNAVAFETQKSEVIQFPGRRREEAVGVHVNGNLIEPADHIRWLGVHLDPRLNFKHHVTTWCGKAMKAAQQMRRFNSTSRGAAPRPLVGAVDMCIVSLATFGSDVWWPGSKRPTTRGMVTSPTSNLCSMIDKANLMGLRAALPVMRTTPNVVVHREGGIPPAKVILEGNRLRLSARLKTLDDRHPLRIRASVCPNVGTRKYKKTAKLSARPEIQMSRLQRAYRELPEAEAPEALAPVVYPKKSGSRLTERNDCVGWINNVTGTDICAYSDGSSEGHGRSTWGYVLKKDGKDIGKGSGIKHGGEVLDAEIIGARKALEAALEFLDNGKSRKVGGSQQIHVFLDSQQAVSALTTGLSPTSLEDVRSFRALSNLAKVLVKWVPGHAGIQGNEEADTIARATLRELPSQDTPPGSCTLAYLRGVMNHRRQKLLEDWWIEACPPKYRQLNLQVRRRKPPELSLSRHLLRELIAARTGHGNFAAYHRRFNNLCAPMECSCGKETTPTHFIHCSRHAQHTRRLRKSMSHVEFIKKLLGPKCHESFKTFAQETG
ncbi:TE1b-like protein [Blumeria hordei DH14]|uniref:TE1b-like protein n=1 Tax=Blumeria graminis f. sp. hordei (strain DH14) TaxID=546991 RepID=N1JEQ5_BLUG1|nr:TE1b-like protein [Blumeria hordei DH14]